METETVQLYTNFRMRPAQATINQETLHHETIRASEMARRLEDWYGNHLDRQRHARRTPYSFHSRFEQGAGTNPEELLAAAHAGCFTMAVSAQLAQAGLKAESLETSCTITLEQKDGAFAITESRLQLKAKVPGASAEAFDKATNAAKSGCPVSKLFNTTITLDAQLEG